MCQYETLSDPVRGSDLFTVVLLQCLEDLEATMRGYISLREGSDFASSSDAGFAGAGMTFRLVQRRVICIAAVAVAAALLTTPSIAQENPAEIIAAHIRQQGFACENALDAQRDHKASKPNETVWTLRCNNGTYRVRLVPNMAAGVELLK